MTDQIHIFEKAGLGLAPFKLIGFADRPFQLPDGTIKAGGTCDYCSQGIRTAAVILSADGKRFDVGCDCVRKVGDAGMIKAVKKHDSEKRAAKAIIRDDKNRAEIERILTEETVYIDRIKAIPHALDWRAAKGETMYDDLKFRLQSSGAAGRARLLKQMKRGVAA